MRNLELLYSRTAKLDLLNLNHISLSTENTGTIFLASNDQLSTFDWESGQTNVIWPLEYHQIVSFEYLSLNNELCVATEAGEVFVYNVYQSTNESVTFCEGGLKAMSWAHDQEVVAFVTKPNTLVVMNSAYDPIAEERLLDDSFGDEAFINIGWGKKETQFHGTEGKQAAHKKPDEIDVKDVTAIDQRISIVWRGDDEYFAVSFIGKSGRMFKVFDKEGKLKYTSEKLGGLDAAIDWRPTGNWISIPYILPNKYTIALFEKNGLRHREIVLPFKKEEENVEKLFWSSDSDILAIYTEHAAGSSIYLYTICNYHWYQKQTLNFTGKCQVIQWDCNYTEGKSLHVIEENLQYSVYRWDYTIARSTGFTADDQALVAVIDRNSLLLTNFRGAVIPPPMSGITLNHSSAINHTGFIRYSSDSSSSSNRFFIIDATNTLSTFECSFERNSERNINLLEGTKLTQTYKIAHDENVPLLNQHWIWLNDSLIVFCHTKDNSTVISLAELSEEKLNIINEHQVNGLVGNVVASNHSLKLVYQLTCGKFESIEILDSKFQKSQFLFDVNNFCGRIDSIIVNGEAKVIALKNQQNLYVDGDKVASDVTSFLLTEQFILFTTLDRLNFIRSDGKEVINERRIERGSKLVTSVPRDSRTILQMPRGNLETIQPRVLSLVIIGELIDVHSYRAAFDLLRKQRINLNLMVDHNPIDFLAHTSEFIADIDNTQWLNLFLSDLLNEDVTVTMYASNYEHLDNRTGKADSVFSDSTKINVICEQFCQIFYQDATTTHLLPMITAYVKQKRVEKALEILWRVRLAELNPSEGKKAAVSAQEALKYLLYLVNVNDLYDVALGMYDFDLVLFVAQKSQKDPKEYLPFLNELKQLEENYRKYRIDNHLKRYKPALEHIVKCGVEKLEECLELIEKHNLYTQALRLFQPGDECYSDVVIQYADHLRAKGVFYEATLMYERGGDCKQALLSAKHTMDWKKCLRLAKKCSHSNENIEKLCLSLLPSLQDSTKFDDAADLVQYFLPHSEQLIKVLCDGNLYQKAILESTNMPESQHKFIQNHLYNFASQTIAKIQADHAEFNNYVSRLKTIRQKKADKLLNGDAEDDDCDMFSDTTSMNSSRFTGGSRSTGKSCRSSKNKRKHQRKLMSLKEGNPFEDIALIDTIYTMAVRIFGQQQQIHELLKSLVDLQLDSMGMEIQQSFNGLLDEISQSLDLVWLPEMMVSGEIKVEEYLDFARVQNDQHYAIIKPHQRAKPLLTKFDWPLEILK